MYYQMYRKNVSNTLDAIFETQEQKLHEAGMVLAQVLEGDGLLYVFGCGHSHMLAEELFYRADLLLCTPFLRRRPCFMRVRPNPARLSV